MEGNLKLSLEMTCSFKYWRKKGELSTILAYNLYHSRRGTQEITGNQFPTKQPYLELAEKTLHKSIKLVQKI